ncbi:MAG: hypothetical protein IIY94_04560, partial [Oscillospiraceae bacterium]|nr:hypothetical protein [Oscillospiraceae bacterium]
DFPVQTDNPAEKLAEGEATEKVNRRTGNLPARAVILSEAKNPHPSHQSPRTVGTSNARPYIHF